MHFGERRRCGDDRGWEERAFLDDVHVLSGSDLYGYDGFACGGRVRLRGFGQGVERAGD